MQVFTYVWYTIEQNDITLLLLNATEIYVQVLDEYPFKLKKTICFINTCNINH